MLVDARFSHGLPPDLSGAVGERATIDHGLKALKGTMPASVISRSTGRHKQDKVRMATIAARGCLRVREPANRSAPAC